MTFGLLQHIGGFLKHFSPIYTHKNTSSENDSLEVKFLEFFKEKKLQENTVDPDLELKKELLLWIQKEKLLNNLSIWHVKPEFSSMDLFWPYFSKLIQNLNPQEDSNSYIRNLKNALTKEETFYIEISKIMNNTRLKGHWKTKLLQSYTDNGLLLNPSIGVYHPTAKSVPFFSTMILFLKIAPNMCTQTTINNLEDLKIMFDFYRQEINPNIDSFDLFQGPQAYFNTFIIEIPKELEKTGIIKLYHKHIHTIEHEVLETKNKREFQKKQAIEEEIFVKQQFQRHLTDQNQFFNQCQKTLKENFSEFSDSLLQLKEEEITENQSIERNNLIYRSINELFNLNTSHLIRLKEIQNNSMLKRLQTAQEKFTKVLTAPLSIQDNQEPASRQKISQTRLADIKALKRKESLERKNIEQKIATRKKAEILSKIFLRKEVYLLQSQLPPQILEFFNRKSISLQQEISFNDLLETKNQTEISLLKKNEQKTRKRMENNALKFQLDPSIETYLLANILQGSKRESILKEEDSKFSEINLENRQKQHFFSYKEKIKQLEDHEASLRRIIDQEMSSSKLVKRNTPYGNKEFPWALQKS